jgi:glutathione S-transferase
MKIYEMKRAPNPRRVRMFLAEKNIPMEYVELDLAKGEHMTPEFALKNPMKKVPVLEFDDGSTLSESIAICRYFEELQPEPPLMGTTPREKADIEMWMRHLEFSFFLPTGMCFQHSSGYFAKFRKTFPEWGEENRTSVLKFLDYLEQHLATHQYLLGDTFTIADISALCTLDFNKVNDIRLDPEKQPNLQRWYQEVSSRPSARA